MLTGGHIPFRKTMVVFFNFEVFERESCERVIFDFPFIIFTRSPPVRAKPASIHLTPLQNQNTKIFFSVIVTISRIFFPLLSPSKNSRKIPKMTTLRRAFKSPGWLGQIRMPMGKCGA